MPVDPTPVRDVKIHTSCRLPVGMLLDIEELMEEIGISRNAVLEVMISRGIESYRAESS